MMKYYYGKTFLNFSWDQVATAFWSRYPNPHSTHVLSEDTILRRLKCGKLYTSRLLTKTNKLPKWGEHFVSGPRFVCVVEESIVDPKKKTMTTYTRNIGYTKIMTVEEKCTYSPSPENKELTVCERQAWISSNLYGFSYALATFGLERFKKNCTKTIKGFEHVLHRMYIPDSVPELPKLHVNKEKLKRTAKKAKELAKSKAGPVVATCTGGATAS